MVRDGWDREALEPFSRLSRTFELLDERPTAGREVGGALARLHAAERGRALYAGGDVEEASELAAGYRIVTAGSGAIVLENERQYERFELDPEADSDQPPPDLGSPVPEPSTWILVAAGLLAVVWLRRARI